MMNPLIPCYSILAITFLLLPTLSSAELISITLERPLALSTPDYTELLEGIGSALVENGSLQSFNLTGAYTKEYNNYTIGPYSIGANSKRQDLKLSLTDASVTITPTLYTIIGEAEVYKRTFNDEGTILIGSSTSTVEETVLFSWSGTTLENTTTRKPSQNTNAYYSITGTNPVTISANTKIFLTKDNVGEYAAVYSQERGTVILEGITLQTSTNTFTAHLSGITIRNGTIEKNTVLTPLSKLSTPEYTATTRTGGVTITNGNHTLYYYSKKRALTPLLNDAKSKGRHVQCK